MAEYIEKDKLIKAFYDEMQSMKNTDRSEAADKVFGILMRYVNSFEAADVQPIQHGKWIGVDYDTYFECSECKHMTDWQNYKYCPYCGARMDGEQ